MEDNFNSIVEYCDSCNLSFEPWNIRQYEVLYQGFKIHDQNKISLCHVCSKIAKYAEQLFINLQGNSVAKQEIHINKKPIKNLCLFNLGTLQLSDDDSCDTDTRYSIISAKHGEILTECGKIKIENNLNEFGLGDDIISDDKEINEINIKQEYLNEEDKTPLKDLISDEIDIKEEKERDSDIGSGSETNNSLETDANEEASNKEGRIAIPIVYLTPKQFMQEKLERSKSEKYLNSQYKCEDCVVGYFHEDGYLKHMENHKESAGPFECKLCTQHTTTLTKLQYHRRKHFTRYKCIKCNILRNQPATIREHLHSVHNIGAQTKYKCSICNAVFNSKSNRKSHIRMKHKPRNKETCNYCRKIYSSLETLKIHLLTQHPEELNVKVQQEKKHICQECGAAFRAPSLLKTHTLNHSDRKDYYCVECDKSFKSETRLKIHLTTTLVHVQKSELPYPCTHCEKRFKLKSEADNHINVHLNIKPYQCDQCSKAFCSPSSIYKHKKKFHEEYKRPLKYKCHICDKAFATPKILKGHIRTHTGERPYKCDICEAAFTHSGTLYNHKKLLHRNLRPIKKESSNVVYNSDKLSED